MSKSEHTPGPWHSVWSPINKEHTISSRGHWDSLAVVNGNEDDELDAQGAANAALIAAAPDLLEELEAKQAIYTRLRRLCGDMEDQSVMVPAVTQPWRELLALLDEWDSVPSAIAKARGES